MAITRIFALVLAAAMALVALPASAGMQEKLFVNLTTDDLRSARMALGFASKALQMEKIEKATVFLNVDAVRLADKRLANASEANRKLQQSLKDFMAAGGTVIICPMCMSAVAGLTAEDLIEGVKLGGPDVTMPAMFDDDTVVVSY